MRHAISRTRRKTAMSCPVNPNARSCAGSAVMTWPILGKFCRRAEAHVVACEGRSNAVSKSCSVVSSVGRTTRLRSTTKPWIGDAGARATDDLDMEDVPESSTGRAEGPLSRRPPTHPVPAVLLLFNGLAPPTADTGILLLQHRRSIASAPPHAWHITRRKPRPADRAGLWGRRLIRRSSCGYETRSGCSSRHPDHRTGWRRWAR